MPAAEIHSGLQSAAANDTTSSKRPAIADEAPAAATAQQRDQPHTTTGTVQYVKPGKNGEELYNYLYELPAGVDKHTNVEHDEKDITVTDLHSVPDTFTLEHNGFRLLKFSVPSDIDWDNKEEVESRYYPLAAKLLKEVTGATRVHIFDHTLRRGHVQPWKGLPKPGMPVSRVHVDYTTKSGVERLNALLPDEAEKLRRTPFAVVQMWRPLKGPVQTSPLGLIDISSVAKEDYLTYALHFPERTGYNYALAANPNHRWYYTKGMNTDEAYIFVCYDSRDGRARFGPHTGFIDHSAAPDAPPRESVELRSYCFWEDQPEQPYATEL